MDKKSVEVLRHFKKTAHPISRAKAIEALGKDADKSITYLLNEGYLDQGTRKEGWVQDELRGVCVPGKAPNGIFEINAKGEDFLEHYIGDMFDKWIVRFTSVIGFITGVSSLILHFLEQ